MGPRSIAISLLLLLSLVAAPVSGESQEVWACVSEIGEIVALDSESFSVDYRFNLTAGNFPLAIDFTPDGEFAYVVCRDSGNVVVLNASSLEEVATIDVGREPFAIEISADGARAFVTNSGDGTISVLATGTMAVEATIQVGSIPRDICISRDGGHAFVCLSGDDEVAVLSLDGLGVERRIGVGGGPWGLDVSTDDRRLYVSCHDEDMVYAIDLDGDEIVKRIEVNERPRGVSVIPGAQRVYVPAGEAVAIIDTVQNYKIDASGIHGDGWEGAVRPDGAYIFVSTVDHDDPIVEVVDISRMEKVESIWLGENAKYPRGLAFRPLLSSGRVPTSITCLGKERVDYNQTMEISGAISPPLQGITVTLVYTDPAASPLIVRKATTDSSGAYTDSFSPQSRGDWRVTASWDGDGEYSGATSAELHFRVGGGGQGEDAGPLPLIVIAVVLIVVVLVLRRRRGGKS